MGDVSFSVELQEPISYSLYILITGLVMMAVALVVFYVFWKRFIDFKNGNRKTLRPKKKAPVVLSVLRRKYLRQIARLEKGLVEQKVDARTAYQELSRIVRAFAGEATGIQIQNYSLAEVKFLNIPQLTTLISAIYKPEFEINTPLIFVQNQDEQSRESAVFNEALERAIAQTKGVISSWR